MMENDAKIKEIATVKHSLSSLARVVKCKIMETNKKIQDGLEKETAGTGMPINKLKGNAKIIAQITNIGGGSKVNGGGGFEEGIKVLFDNVSAKRMLQTINLVTQSNKILE